MPRAHAKKAAQRLPPLNISAEGSAVPQRIGCEAGDLRVDCCIQYGALMAVAARMVFCIRSQRITLSQSVYVLNGLEMSQS